MSRRFDDGGHGGVSVETETKENASPGGGGDSHMKQTGMLVGNLEFNP